MSEDWSKTIFREEAEELLAELEVTLLELEQAPNDATLVNRVFRALHTIKGSGAMFGFDEIASFTHEMESLFDRVRAGSLVVTHDMLSVSFRARDHIRNLLAESLSEEEKKRLADGILQDVGAVERSQDQQAPPAEPFAAPAGDTVSGAARDKKEEEDAPRRVFQVRLRPRADSLPQGYPLAPLFEELAALGTTEVEHHADGSDKESWTVTLETVRSEDDVRDIFFFAEVDLDVAIAVDGKQAEFDVASVPSESSGPAGSPESPVPPAPGSDGNKAEPALSDEESATSILAGGWREQPARSLRVSAGKLDKLVDLVGELVIIQSQLSQLATERQDTPLTTLAEGLERLADELRDTTLGVRMVPIGISFSKFHRLVRDLCEELGKEVELVTEGGETELDKTVIERLADPLVHLVRNSMDHGMEPPSERKAQGKPGKGRIRISAEHSGGEVLIRLEDDGRGIDLQALRATALERGLVDEGEDMGERDLFRLLFEPGFSTAGKITSVSGRGVGLDVVGQAIDSLRGSIDISSVPGRGTAIAVRLPLTLAIIDGLQVRTGSEYYVMPLNMVQECIELTRDQRREAEGRRLLDMRGEIVPYVNLREWFQISGKRPDIEHVVVTRVEKRRVGFVVDEVVGEHQTVIKTLGRVYRNVEGISGATIRGDGSIALILDVPGVVRSLAQAGG